MFEENSPLSGAFIYSLVKDEMFFLDKIISHFIDIPRFHRLNIVNIFKCVKIWNDLKFFSITKIGGRYINTNTVVDIFTTAAGVL